MAPSRLFPASRRVASTPLSTPLSIVDATVARFTPAGAIWVYDATPENIIVEEFVGQLQFSFESTLDLFPHWAGQLHWADFRPGGKHTERFNRPVITYGGGEDPGVEWTVVHRSSTVSGIVSTSSDRASGDGVWIGDSFPQDSLISKTNLALHDLHDCDGLPAMTVQVTLFDGGGWAVGIKMAHVLADVQSVMVFVHHWAASCSASTSLGHSRRPLADAPVFDPALLDAHAAGDIDAPSPDPELCKKARGLPVHRFDWWQAPMASASTENSRPSPHQMEALVAAGAELSPGDAAPWDTWDFSKTVSYALIHFTGQELESLKSAARESDSRGRAGTITKPGVSRLDALLAHVWAAINRARFPRSTNFTTTSVPGANDQTDVYLNVALGARTRVQPPLPDGFIGSPNFPLVYVQGAVRSAARDGDDESMRDSIGATARKIRETIGKFTAEAMGALLHDAAHEISPQRLWQAFMGKNHTLVTSWLRLRAYDLHFDGTGQRPRYVHAVMPKCDGLVQVMDAAVEDGGMDVALYLDADSMERLLHDSKLRV